MPEPLPRDAGADDLVCRAAPLGTIDEQARTVDCVASTPAIDSYGDSVAPRWRLARFAANPVLLYNHQRYGELPIGTVENVRLEGDALCATIRLATAEANPKAEQVWQSIRQRTLRTVSVGFVPATVRYELRDGREVCVLDDNELVELSVTPVPANPEAVLRMRARARGGAPVPRGPAPPPSPDPHTEVASMEFLPLAAKLGIAAAHEEAAKSAVLALAEEGAAVRATLGTKSQADTAARVAELSTAAAELPKVRAERDALAAERTAREAVERRRHVDALIEANAALEPARPALEAFAAQDFAGFAKRYPLPANTARERALTGAVVPRGGAPEASLVHAAPEGERLPAGPEAQLAAADEVARALMQKDAALSYTAAFRQASAALAGARRAARS